MKILYFWIKTCRSKLIYFCISFFTTDYNLNGMYFVNMQKMFYNYNCYLNDHLFVSSNTFDASLGLLTKLNM